VPNLLAEQKPGAHLCALGVRLELRGRLRPVRVEPVFELREQRWELVLDNEGGLGGPRSYRWGFLIGEREAWASSKDPTEIGHGLRCIDAKSIDPSMPKPLTQAHEATGIRGRLPRHTRQRRGTQLERPQVRFVCGGGVRWRGGLERPGERRIDQELDTHMGDSPCRPPPHSACQEVFRSLRLERTEDRALVEGRVGAVVVGNAARQASHLETRGTGPEYRNEIGEHRAEDELAILLGRRSDYRMSVEIHREFSLAAAGARQQSMANRPDLAVCDGGRGATTQRGERAE